MNKLNKTLHKWVSLIVGIQLLIWLGTGLYFNLVDGRAASGNENRVRVQHEGNIADFQLFPINRLQVEGVQEMDLVWLMQKPYYALTLSKGAHSYQKSERVLFDAVYGQRHLVSEEEILDVAKSSYKGQGELISVTKLMPPIVELPKQENPVWQVTFDDEQATNVYLSADTGRVLAHINDSRRLRDLMFKLHFMDYGNVGSFNNWFSVLFAFLSLSLSVTGAVWVVQMLKRGSYRIGRRRKGAKVRLGRQGA